jgi:hypothetical protein
VGRVPFLIRSIIEHHSAKAGLLRTSSLRDAPKRMSQPAKEGAWLRSDYSAMSGCCSLQDEYCEILFSIEIRSGIPSFQQLSHGNPNENILFHG